MPNPVHPASPRVFISSTVAEFRDLRSALAYTLRSQGITVYLSEAADFDVKGDRPALEECFDNVRASDYYILLIGGARGSLYEDGVSVTRQEYRVARDHCISSGKPVLLLFLRNAAELALNAGDRAQNEVGIDDPEHLRSFIDEVQNPEAPSAPSYLKRFDDFEDVMTGVAGRLNLGRDLSETLTRHSLGAELTRNIARIVHRHGRTVFPHHYVLTPIRKEIPVTPTEMAERVKIPRRQFTGLAMALIPRTSASELRSTMLEEAIASGVFLKFDAVTGALDETSIHRALVQALDDVESLRRLDTLDQEFLNVSTTVRDALVRNLNHCEVNTHDLTIILAYYDRLENILNGHIALCQVFLGVVEELPTFKRTPLTPHGAEVVQGICAEQVSATEVQHLIRSNVFPLGTRPLAETMGATREQQVQTMVDWIRDILEGTDGAGLLDEDGLRTVAEGTLDRISASPEEGIEKIDRPAPAADGV
jgi:hypothetical protein